MRARRPVVFALAVAGTGMLVAPGIATAQGPAAGHASGYQVIRIKCKVYDLDGRPLEGATVAARLDPEGAHRPPDKQIKAKAGEEEILYSLDDTSAPVLSKNQTVNDLGNCEIPLVVYADRPDAIDYLLSISYGGGSRNLLRAAERSRAISSQDAGATITLHADVRAELRSMQLLMGGIAFLGGTLMGFLLFFKGMYPRWLSQGKGIDLSRALCWSGAIFVCMLMLGLVYWWLFPHYINLYVFFGVLFVIWLIHLLVAVLPARSHARS